ncbi:MAG TPA: hypothetical protein PKK26_12660 [Candidatus Wallbacteria bacterium]|nr:hypothetical protein [Candidatus Wallbacteria bacterium]
MDINELYQLVLSGSMSELDIWLIYREDRYETVLGDGFFIYFDKAFFKREDAEAFARSERDKSVVKSPEYGCHYYLYRALLFPEPGNYAPAVKCADFIAAFDDAYRVENITPAICSIAQSLIIK